jgi:class 3 adenylate cyclase
MSKRGRHPNQPLTRELRASDEDRERVVELLREHYAAGRLSADELAERIEQAYQARAHSELGPLTVDLAPQLESRAAQAGPSGRPRSGSDAGRSQRVVTPAGHGLRTSFHIHLTVYIVVNLALVLIWAVTGAGYFWPIWPLIGWGIGVGAHYAPILAGVGARAPRLPWPRDMTPTPRGELAPAGESAEPSGESASLIDVAASVGAERPSLRPAEAPDGTVTILFSDIEGSTELNERLGDDRWLELLRRHHRILREQIDAYGGFEVKVQGDGFMVAFSSARRAIECAQAIQRAFAAELGADPNAPIRVRIGLHTGEPVREAGDFYGKAVVVAARIAGEAHGGEILTSAIVKEMVAQSSDAICFEDDREVSLKGLAGTYRIYRVADPAPPA